MIYYLNKEMVKFIKRTNTTRKVKFHDVDFITIDVGCPYSGVIIKDIEEMPRNAKN